MIKEEKRDLSHTVIEMNCPGCNAPVSVGQKECDYCHSPIVISTFNSVYTMPMPQVNKYAAAYRKALSENPDDQSLNTSIAMCYLKLKLYDKATEAFEKAVEDNFDNSETFFYAAICLLQGKKAFLQQRATIDKALEYINAALMIEPKGIYYCFLAYIKYDYFERKFLNTTPNFRDCIRTAYDCGLSEHDVQMLFGILGVDRPSFI